LPGLGSEAGETRRYTPGDDPRRIDWNVTARAQVPHVRDAVAEREVESWLVVDLSPSTDFGTALCTKRDLVLAAAGAFALLTSRSGDRVGAHILTHDRIVTLPARAGGAQARALLDTLATAPRGGAAALAHERIGHASRGERSLCHPVSAPAAPGGAGHGPAHRPGLSAGGAGPDLGDALDLLARRTRRRGLAVIVSDFPGPGRWIPAMQAVAARHETLAIEVLDPRELDLPDVGMLVVADVETGQEREVRTGDAGLRRRYAAATRAQRRATATALRERAVDHLVLRTDRDATADLVTWLAQRPRRLAHLRRQQRVGSGRRGRS
jgi:uncharacterized protein (DUF58 family)